MGIFDQPLLGYSPALEPPGWDLLRDMLQRKIFQLQGNPYGFDPSAGRSMASLWSGNGRGKFNPFTGSYGSSDMGSSGPMGGMSDRMTPVLAGSGDRGGGPLGWEWGDPNSRTPRVVGRDAGFSPMRGGDIPASHAIKNPMNRHMMLKALIGHLMRQKAKKPAMPPIPLGQDARMPVVPAGPRGPNPTGSPDTSGTGGIPRTVPGGTSRPPMDTPTGTAAPYRGGRGGGGDIQSGGSTNVGGGSSGGGGGGGWYGDGRNWWSMGGKGPRWPGHGEAGGAKDGYDAPYMFQRSNPGPLGMDANNGSYSVGVRGGTMTNFPDHPGSSLYVPWGANFDDMVAQFLASFGDQGGGDAGSGSPTAVGGGGAGGGGGSGFGIRKKKYLPELGTGTMLGQDGYMDQPNNDPGGRDFGMREGDNPSSVGPYRAVPRPPGADATQWGNW